MARKFFWPEAPELLPCVFQRSPSSSEHDSSCTSCQWFLIMGSLKRVMYMCTKSLELIQRSEFYGFILNTFSIKHQQKYKLCNGS